MDPMSKMYYYNMCTMHIVNSHRTKTFTPRPSANTLNISKPETEKEFKMNI